MFDPSREQARNFFIGAWRKQRSGEVLTPLESIAADIVSMHPEYHGVLDDADALARDFPPEAGQMNPFLHLALHLAIEEQLSIDQPAGLATAFKRCQLRRGNRHDALHDVLECLAETLFHAQRNGTPPDGVAYVECVMRRASAD
jgi:hypothetical protein